ncbi:hypothetical protein [Methylobacterium oryzae]|uniref:hypothetical protein n=1 Tax=Methylobacterium oryzae TaxID=334852 RepID=UPI001F48DBC1|nr:hypothetical protein [Methylobacterium oryzae]UIN32914.1 hypothetical protein LXM90_17640 [Methylobacterium oryzae]
MIYAFLRPSGAAIVSTLYRRIFLGRVPKIFDATFYLKSNPDVAASGLDPYFHYVYYGSSQGLDPAEDFHTLFYRNQSGPTKLDPVRHYIRYGVKLGIDPNPNFSSSSYLARYPDVAERAINPLLHYRTNGKLEGRLASASASKTGDITALVSVPSRFIFRLPSESARQFTFSFFAASEKGLNYQPAARICYFLQLSHREIELLVDALSVIQANSVEEVEFRFDLRNLSHSIERGNQEFVADVKPKIDTVLIVFEGCYFHEHGSCMKINFLESRIWDLRGPNARVAEVFSAGSVRVDTDNAIAPNG